MTDRRRRIVIDDDEDYGSRGGGSSQRNTGKRQAPSNNQGSSGSQKRVIRDDSDQDSDSYTTNATRQTTSGTKATDIAPEDFERLVKDVVRLAIFTSHSEQALKREDIKNVLSDHSRLYDSVFQKAQERLRDIFGMELVELTTKGRSGQATEKGMFA
ncbi:hypothetical protein BGX21_011199 [Mortierella sp. AD011]|nr:hypothetical protein BGX20_010610 [Mortierella sp. AD010]KAF9391656.1 hypothetical protein BGX21_011199 [Mortierella sp. AD011]